MLDQADLSRVRARDPAALDRFFHDYFDRAFGLIARVTGDRAVAEDLTQETFLRIHRALPTLDPVRDPWPWVASIAVNVCRDHRASAASRARRRTRSLDAEPSLAANLRSRDGDPEDLAAREQETAKVQAALDRVPLKDRLVVLLHAWQGFGHDEIARMTGRSHAAVRQQYRRALAALAQRLKEGDR
jgi:RNA polymerase sigma-70 factor (ECF subfamily)